MSTLAARDPLVPRSFDGNGPGALLSLAAHGALVAALAYGVGWRSPTPTPISAELWAAVPQVAAPRAEEPPPTPAPTPTPAPQPPQPVPVQKPVPPPPDPQIAIEQARREKAKQLAQEKAAAEQARKAEQTKKAEQAAEEARIAKLREENMRRLMGQINGTGEPTSRGTAAVTAAPSAAYAGKLVKAIKDNLIFDWRGPGNPAAEVEVRSGPSGTITGKSIVKSSGVKEWDEAVLRAIEKTARLPADTDGRVPPTLTITFRPRD